MKQNQGSKTKTYATIIIVIVVFALIYFYSSGSTPPATSLIPGASYGAVGTSELALLNQVRTLRIDTAIFTDPAFRSLVDYSVAIAPENVYRPNPFAPLPGVPSPNAPQQQSQGTTPKSK